MNNLFQNRHNVSNHGDFSIGNEYVRIAQYSFHFISIGCHIRRNVATVELHAFNSFQMSFHGLGFFNSDNTVVANFFHSIGNQVTDFIISCGNRSNLCFCSLGFNLLGNIFQFVNQYINCFFDTFFQNHRVSAGSNVAHTFVNHSLCQNGSSGSAVTGNIVGFDGYFFNQLCAHVFKRIFQFDVAGNGYTVIGDGRCAEFLFQYNVTAFRTEGYFYSVSQSIYATLQATTSFFIKQNLFSHFISLL